MIKLESLIDVKLARNEAIHDCVAEISRRTINEATTDEFECGYRTALLDLENAILKLLVRK